MNDDEEKLQMRVDIERLKKSIRQKEEMIEEMEIELNDALKKKTTNGCSERETMLASKLLDSQYECETKNALLLDRELKIESLEKEVDRLEKSNRELANISVLTDQDETANSFTEAELLKISEEFERCKIDLARVLTENADLKKSFLTLKEEHETAIDHIKSLETHMKGRDEELQRMEGELFHLKNSTGEHASKGNSIFVEAMEAERKLEHDLKTLYREKQCLQSLVKRLTEEKEDAEQRARNSSARGTAVQSALNEADFTEMMRLRHRVKEMEKEKTHLWERLFIKMKSTSKKDMGPLIVAYFDGFRGSIESLKASQTSMSKKNDELVIQNRCLKIEVDKMRAKCENLEGEISILNRRLTSIIPSYNINGQAAMKERRDHVPSSASKSSVFSRPSVFQSAVVTNDKVSTGLTGLELSMNNVSVTPQKFNISLNSTQLDTPRDENTSWVERRERAKSAKKEVVQPKYKFVELTFASNKPLFKPPTLVQTATTQSEQSKENQIE